MSGPSSSKFTVYGVDLSVWQYRWLFADLGRLNEQQCQIHWDLHGCFELACFKRRPDLERLTHAKVQKLSEKGREEPSPFFSINIGNEAYDVLDIIFTHCNVPPGVRVFSHVNAKATHSILTLNTANNDWYQRGIPGLTTSIASTVAFLQAVKVWLNCRYVRTIGCSMGGYAAILFGDLLDVDKVIACDPELIIGRPRMRSWEWNAARVYEEAHRNLIPSLQRLGARASVSLSGYDPMEAETARMLIAANHQPILTKFFHGNPTHIEWPEVFSNPYASLKLKARTVFEPPEDAVFKEAAELYRDAFDGVAKADDPKYQRAREAFESVSLYDAVLHCSEGNVRSGMEAMRRYAAFREELAFDEKAEPLFDIERRFRVPRDMAMAIMGQLLPMLPEGRASLSNKASDV